MRNYDQEAADLPERLYAYNFDYRMHDFMVRAFRQHYRQPKASTALELGCYKGEFTRRLVEDFGEVSVVEASGALIEHARDAVSGRARFVQSRFEDYTPEAPVDHVFLLHTLEHLDDPVGVLERIRGWLSERGQLFLVVPNADAASRQIAVKMGLIPFNQAVTAGEDAHGHRATYSFDTLEQVVRAAGLCVRHRQGLLFKGLANFQMDRALAAGIIDDEYLEGCYQLGLEHPRLCSSIFFLCDRADV